VGFQQTDPPDTGVSAPQNDKFYSQLTTISGTCTDDFSGVDVNEVYIKLIDITNPSTYYYFDGAGAWVQDLTWLEVSVSTPNWSYTKAENIFRWKNGHTYLVVPRAKDNAQNTETTFSTTTFKYDKNTQETWDEYPGEPDSDVSSPASDTYYKSLTFEGTTLSSAGIKEVYIRLRDETADPDKWWTGTSWSTYTINWLLVTGKDSWSYSFNDSNWVSNHKYILNTKAYDNTDVPGSNEEVSISTRTFYIDLSSPTNVQVASPSGDVKTRPSTISGTAFDNTGTWESGISEVKVTIYDVDVSSYFNTQTNSWQGSIYWATTTLTGSPVDGWNLSITTFAWTDGHQYQLKCRAWDGSGNWTDSAYTYFVFDETPPESFIAVPVDGNYYPAGEPTTLNGTASDNKSGVTEVVVRIMRKSGANAGEHWSVTDHTWHPVIEGIIWSTTTLTGSNPWNWEIPSSNLPSWEDGVSYLVVAKSKDAANNEESVFTVGIDSNTFTYDTSQPEVAVTTPSTHVNFDPVIYGTSMDYSPGVVSEVRVQIRRQDGAYWAGSDWGEIGEKHWVLADGTVNWSYSGVKNNSAWGNELEYSVWAKARDDAGNWSEISSSQTFIVDKSSPSSGVTVPQQMTRMEWEI